MAGTCPNVNDLADVLADAMRRPLTGSAGRADHIHFRGNPRWEELFPHPKELGIETSIHDELPMLEIVYEDFLRQMRKASPGQKELADLNREARKLTTRLKAIERRRAELMKELDG